MLNSYKVPKILILTESVEAEILLTKRNILIHGKILKNKETG